MTTVTEALAGASKSPLGAVLEAGVNVLDANQTIVFTLYKKMVLPLDEFVYWVNYSLITPVDGDPPATVNIMGALHHATEVLQEEDSTISQNTMIFTALARCDIFQQMDPQFLYIAEYQGINFAFSSQNKYFQQADLWHYMGVAITSIMRPQLIEDQEALDSLKLVVSNSLPIWLNMPNYRPPYPGFVCPFAKMYPSFLVPENELPPYASVHIEETVSLVEAAMFGPTLTSTQLSQETVRVTLFGVNNDDAITFLNFVLQYSYDWNFIGIANMPIIKDEKLAQPELETIAQKKVIDFRINYVQNSVRDIARQFILHAKVKYIPSGSGILPRTKAA